MTPPKFPGVKSGTDVPTVLGTWFCLAANNVSISPKSQEALFFFFFWTLREGRESVVLLGDPV